MNEKSTASVVVKPYDKDGNAATPNSMTYRIDCLTSGNSVKTETILTPATSVTITITPTENAMQVATNDYEIKEVTVTSEFNPTPGVDTLIETHKYRVQNLNAVT